MTGVSAVIAAARNLPCRIATNWNSPTGASPQTTLSKTIIKPSGNGGVLRWDIVGSTGGTIQYQKNSDAYATVTDNATVTFADGDTLNFKLTGGGTDVQVVVYDNLTGVQVGSTTITCS